MYILNLNDKVKILHEPDNVRSLGRNTVYVLQNLNNKEKELLQEFFWFDHQHPRSFSQKKYFT